MERYTNAILWPANLNEAGPDMLREEADVEENLRFLRKRVPFIGIRQQKEKS